MEEDNFDDLERHVVLNRWSEYCRWCSPEALQISEGELKRVHDFFAVAIKDVSVTHLAFRGNKYRLQRHEAPAHFYAWTKPHAELTVTTEDYKFSYHHPVPRSAATPEEQVIKTIARRLSHNKVNRRCPAAAIVDGVVLRVRPPPLPLQPAPEASAEPGHSKFLYRHAVIKFYDLCVLCVVRVPSLPSVTYGLL
jgi:hypothetical protein